MSAWPSQATCQAVRIGSPRSPATCVSRWAATGQVMTTARTIAPAAASTSSPRPSAARAAADGPGTVATSGSSLVVTGTPTPARRGAGEALVVTDGPRRKGRRAYPCACRRTRPAPQSSVRANDAAMAASNYSTGRLRHAHRDARQHPQDRGHRRPAERPRDRARRSGGAGCGASPAPAAAPRPTLANPDQVGHEDTNTTHEIYARVLRRQQRANVGAAFNELMYGARELACRGDGESPSSGSNLLMRSPFEEAEHSGGA